MSRTVRCLEKTTMLDSWRTYLPGPLFTAVSDARGCYHIPGTRVLLDGVDVSGDCYRAEELSNGTGSVFLYKRNQDGKFYLDGHDIASERRFGKVEIIPPPDLDLEIWRSIQAKAVEAANEQK